jgi:hypothetical protein
LRPGHRDLEVVQHFNNGACRGRRERTFPYGQKSEAHRVGAVDVLFRGDVLDQFLGFDAGGQGSLQDDAIDGGLCAEVLQHGDEHLFGRVVADVDDPAADAGVFRGALYGANVPVRRAVLGRNHDGEGGA